MAKPNRRWVAMVEARRPLSSTEPPATRGRQAWAECVGPARNRLAFRREARAIVHATGWQLVRVDVDRLDRFGPETPQAQDLVRQVERDGRTHLSDWSFDDENAQRRCTRERINDLVGRWLWWLGVPIFAMFVLPILISDIPDDYRAQFGSGVSGTFTVTERECARTCLSTGAWRADDGSYERQKVGLATGAGAPPVGTAVRAMDVGNRALVYPEHGGWDWLINSTLLVALLVALAFWIVRAVERARYLLPALRERRSNEAR